MKNFPKSSAFNNKKSPLAPEKVLMSLKSRFQTFLMKLPSMASHRVGHDWSDLAAAAACLQKCLPTKSSFTTGEKMGTLTCVGSYQLSMFMKKHGSDGKESACCAGDLGSIPGSGRSPREENGNPFQYSCPENPHWQRSLEGYSPRGRRRVRHDWMTKQQHLPSVSHLWRCC